MNEQCSSDIRRCEDCWKFGKRYTHQYASFCLLTAEEASGKTRRNCWCSGIATEPMVMCDPPVELKGCD